MKFGVERIDGGLFTWTFGLLLHCIHAVAVIRVHGAERFCILCQLGILGGLPVEFGKGFFALRAFFRLDRLHATHHFSGGGVALGNALLEPRCVGFDCGALGGYRFHFLNRDAFFRPLVQRGVSSLQILHGRFRGGILFGNCRSSVFDLRPRCLGGKVRQALRFFLAAILHELRKRHFLQPEQILVEFVGAVLQSGALVVRRQQRLLLGQQAGAKGLAFLPLLLCGLRGFNIHTAKHAFHLPRLRRFL